MTNMFVLNLTSNGTPDAMTIDHDLPIGKGHGKNHIKEPLQQDQKKIVFLGEQEGREVSRGRVCGCLHW